MPSGSSPSRSKPSSRPSTASSTLFETRHDDRVLVTAGFSSAPIADDAILRVHEKVRANMDRIPIGIPEPLIVGRGIDDVAIVTLTLAPKSEAAARYPDNALYHMAEDLLVEMAKLEDIGLSYITGGRPDQIRVEPDRGAAFALRDHAGATRRQGARGEPLVPGRAWCATTTSASRRIPARRSVACPT